MISTDQTICLCMIVKNEAHVIERSLASARPLISHWIVVDTGSTDGTQERVRAAMADLPGMLVERPWVDFAHNRSEALALARPHAGYTLVLDADDEFVLPEGFVLPPLSADSYAVDILYNDTAYQRPQLVRNALPWRYRGVLHEFLDCPEATTSGHLPIRMRINHEGARSTDPHTYARDAAILAAALASEADPFLIARYTFYLAQSHRDCGRWQEALDAYLRRAELGFWLEEVYVSLYQAGRMRERLDHTPEAVLATYARASAICPGRAEAAHAASRFCRLQGRHAEGCRLAEPALGLPVPADGLFVEPWIYAYGLLDEFAVNAYWAGRFRACLDAALRALESGKVPAAEQPRLLANMRFSLDRLPEEAPAPDRPDAAAAAEPAPAAPDRPPLPTCLNLGSGKDFREDWLNLDVDPGWHPDVLLDLSTVRLGPEGVSAPTRRFGEIRLRPDSFDTIVANDVLEHVPDLVGLMTACLGLLKVGGRFRISVPYDLSFGAWQDPTHVRTFNERSWLYYTEWFWYLGWDRARFVVEAMEHVPSPFGEDLRARGLPAEEIHRTPRAIDAMTVVLRKAELTQADRATLARWRRDRRQAERRNGTEPAGEDGAGAPFRGGLSENRDRFCLFVAAPPGYAHRPVFEEVAATLGTAFEALGGSAPLAASEAEFDGRTPIVLGGHLVPDALAARLPPQAVLLNLEPFDAPALQPGSPYRDLLRRFPVLDYSRANTRVLHEVGLGHVRHLALRPMPGPAPIAPAAHQDIDVLFYGSMNARRAEILSALRGSGLRVVDLFGVYGPERDAAIARAKVVVNIHFYPSGLFEATRVGPLLARGACVVSEGRPDDPDAADLAEGFVQCPYDAIVEHCRILCRDEAARHALGARARRIASARTQAEALAGLFANGQFRSV